MFVLRTDLTVVEEILQVSEGLALEAPFEEVGEDVVLTLLVGFRCEEVLLESQEVYTPDVNGVIITTRCEEMFSIRCATDAHDLIGVSDQSHSFIGVAIKG